MTHIQVDEKLLDAIVRSTVAGLQMASVVPAPTGYSRLIARGQEIAVMVGLVGRRNGTVTLNLSTRAAIYLANKFMDSDHAELNEEVFDAVGEITNIVAGRLKAELEGRGVSNISCPSIVVGADYNVYHFRGFETVSVEFELEGMPAILLRDRTFSTAVSLSQS